MAAAASVDSDCEPSLKNIVEQTSLKWVFVGGKGGVGKTTVSCSLAVQLSKVRESVLIISTDPAHSLSDAFGQKLTDNPTLVEGFTNLYAMEYEVKEFDKLHKQGNNADNLSEKDRILKMISDAMPNVEGIPGANEFFGFFLFSKLIHSPEHSVVVFDTAPTGHTMRMLGIGRVFEKTFSKQSEYLAKLSPLISQLARMLGGRSMADGLANLGKNHPMHMLTEVNGFLSNPLHTTFVCVCVAEFLPLYETERMVQHLRKYGIDTHNIVVNQLNLQAADSKPCSRCTARQRLQKKYMDQITDLYEDFHITKLPIMEDEVRGVDMLEPFSEYLLHPYDPEGPSARTPFLRK